MSKKIALNHEAVNHKEEPPVLEILSNEILAISKEIENLPDSGSSTLTSEQMMRMQQIDFCSQRLVAVADLVSHLSKLETGCKENLRNEIKDQIKLEHIQKLFG